LDHEFLSQLEQIDDELIKGFTAEGVAELFKVPLEDVQNRRKYLIECGRLIERTFEL